MQSRLAVVVIVAAACTRGTMEPVEASGTAAIAPPASAASGTPGPEPSSLLAAESAWTARSADKRIGVFHAAAAGGACLVSARDGVTGEELWRSDACLGWRSEPVFVSPRGDRVLVLHRATHGATSDWSTVTVASLFERGKLVRAFRGDELIARERISAMRAEETWARGLGEEGRALRPRYDPGDRVRIETVDGRILHLGFDGKVTSVDPVAVAAGEGPPEDDEAGLYRWTDDAGDVHYTNGAGIPRRYRSRAKPVRAEIGVVPVERVSADFAPSRRITSPARPPPGPSPTAAPVRPQPHQPDHYERSRELADSCVIYPWKCSGVKINQKPQVCTTKGDITSCRDKE